MNDVRSISDLLNDRTYHIEFNGHLTNHVKHAVVALARLGADPERIRSYYDQYAELTPYGYALEAPVASSYVITQSNWKQLFGKRGRASGRTASSLISRSKSSAPRSCSRAMSPSSSQGGSVRSRTRRSIWDGRWTPATAG